jgi:hypothetical protein
MTLTRVWGVLFCTQLSTHLRKAKNPNAENSEAAENQERKILLGLSAVSVLNSLCSIILG